ncbi:50S ribosomal protein L9 [Haloglycomyces albus]|uniref:50S ribosomal protein L9 n=1 Tax=Haloglycomyces albus TaxID=526067 RepID=UPI00046CFD00|nr:50S ribosomal protein L9 [Haloglycomyces albus]
MKVILNNEVSNLGSAGEVVEVRPGYARNYLVPQGLAVAWTKGGQKAVDQLRRGRHARAINDFEKAKEVAEKLKKTDAHIIARVGENDRLFGSVTAADVADAVKRAGGPEIDRRRLVLPGTIKALGTYDIQIRLHPEVTGRFKLQVTPAKRTKK